MSLNSGSILKALITDAKTLGVFRKVNGHEPKNAPGQGTSLAFWLDRIRPARSSGLNSTSGLLVCNARAQSPMLADPQDEIDPELARAADLLLGRYIAGFTLGGLVRKIDVRGQEGIPLEGRFAYLEQDRRQFRTFELTIPMIVNDCWTESA